MNKIQKMPLLAAILIYLFCNPYFIWGAWHTGSVKILFTGILSALFLFNLDVKEKGRGFLFILLLFLLAFTSYMRGNNFVGLMASVMTCVLPFSKEKFAKTTLDYFVTIFSVIIGISAVMYILALLKVAPVIGTMDPLNGLKNYNYTLYPLLAVGNDHRSTYIRFCGPFDEPGVVGTISALILTIYKFNLKDKRLLTIFMTGFLSLSFFYYAVVAVYYLVYNIFVAKNNKNSFIVIAISALFVVITFNNSLMYDTIWSRFAWDSSSGTFSGDNRMGENGRDFFMSIIGTKEFYFGSTNYDAFAEMVEGSASFISVIVRYGAVFSVLFIYLFASYGWRYKDSNISYLLFLFVFIGCIYQRPFIFDPSYMYLFSMMAIMCGVEYNQVETN